MKKALITLTLAAVSAGAFAQGKVTFGNDASHLFYYWDLGPIPVSPLPNGRSLQVVLYAGTSVALALQTSYVLDAANWLTDGRMVNKPVILTGVPGAAVANFQIILTDTGAVLPHTITGGATGLVGAQDFGTSGLFTATPGASLSYPGLVSGGPAGSTWTTGITAGIPEPSSMALAGLGAATLVILRRRK